MSGLAVLYAVTLTWSWYRRSGRFTIDLLVMFKFVLFGLGTVADAIFVVIFTAALYSQFCYKVRQPRARFVGELQYVLTSLILGKAVGR